MGSDEGRASALRQELASLRRSRHWLAAVEVARELTELEPEDGDNWFWLARALENMLDLPGALAAYEEALAHDFDEEGLREAAEVGLQRVRAPVDEAERERAAKEHARRQREEALRTVAELSSFSAAIDAAARARDGSDIEIYVAAATRALELADDYDKRVIALTSQGAALRRAGQLKEAIEVLEEAVSIDGSPTTNHRAYTALVAALREAGEYKRAVPHAESVLEVRPDDAYMLWAAVLLFTAIYEEDGHPSARARAQEYAERAAQVAPEERTATRSLEALAEALERFGEAERAAGVRALLDVLPEPGTPGLRRIRF